MFFRDFSIIMLLIFYEIKYKTVNAAVDQGDRISSGPSPTWKKVQLCEITCRINQNKTKTVNSLKSIIINYNKSPSTIEDFIFLFSPYLNDKNFSPYFPLESKLA